MTKSVNQIPGVLFADVNFASGLMVLEYDTTVDPRAQAVGVVTGAGHLVAAVQGDDRPTAEPAWLVRHRAEVSVVASGALIVGGWLLGLADATTAAAISYAAAILTGGALIWRRAAASLMARTLDMNVLMTIAVSGAAALGEWGEGATVVFLFALGGLLEARSLARTRRSIRDLMALAPEQARIRRGGAEIIVPPAEVLPGETMLVRPGERVPLDGVIVNGASAFDESPVTGESVPRDRAGGDPVFAGSLNTTGLVEVRVTASAGETVLARIVHLVEVAQASRAPVQRFVDRFSRVYTPVVIAVAALLAFGAPALGQASGLWPGFESWQEWVYRALVLLVVSCPCALVVSTPVAIVSAIARASRDGVLVKGGAFLERAASVRAVLFDKTGTLTEGRPVLAETVTLAADSADDALAMAAALEAHSNHPLARAVVAAAEVRRGDGGGEAADTRGASGRPQAESIRELAGQGVTGTIGGVEYAVGSAAMARDRVALGDAAEKAVGDLEDRGLSVLVLMMGAGPDARAIALLGIADAVRPDASVAVSALRAAGVEHVVMLTGDNPRVAARVAAETGVTDFRARLLPEDKTTAVHVLRERYKTVAMVGDGVNDAPALAAADIGIAMGAAGSDTAIEVADVALMRDDLSALADFLDLGRRTMRVIRQNVAMSLVIKAAVLVLAVSGNATLWMAVFADTGVALIVIFNGLRLLRAR